VGERNETLLIDDPAEQSPRRSSRRPAPPTWSSSPITVALVVAGVLVVIGVSLAIIAPLVSGSPSAQTLPPVAGASVAAPSAGPSTPGPSLQANPNPSIAVTPTGRFRPDQLESDVIKMVNTARKAAQCREVRNNSRLHNVARAHSVDMATNSYVGSTGSDGSSYRDRAHNAKYADPLGENVAHGPITAAAVMQVWLNNGSARSRILDCQATNIGVGVAQGSDGSYYWTQDFGR
jgi:uncharacterized protein YkwD